MNLSPVHFLLILICDFLLNDLNFALKGGCFCQLGLATRSSVLMLFWSLAARASLDEDYFTIRTWQIKNLA